MPLTIRRKPLTITFPTWAPLSQWVTMRFVTKSNKLMSVKWQRAIRLCRQCQHRVVTMERATISLSTVQRVANQLGLRKPWFTWRDVSWRWLVVMETSNELSQWPHFFPSWRAWFHLDPWSRTKGRTSSVTSTIHHNRPTASVSESFVQNTPRSLRQAFS